jgi:predicted nucleotidyltransferase
MPEEFPIDFFAILTLLTDAGVRFVVVGGVAMHLHGASNVTFDFDVAFARDPADFHAVERLTTLLDARCVRDAPSLRDSTYLTLETVRGNVDLMANLPGMDCFAGLWERATMMEVDGCMVRVASLDDLIAMKRAANRPKDREHIIQIQALQCLKNEKAGQED